MTIGIGRRGVAAMALGLLIPWAPASGQMGSMGGGRSLGGYGGPAISSYYAGRGSAYAPYAGGGGAYAPPVAPMRPAVPIPRGGPDTAIGGASSPGMAGGSGMGAASRSPRRALPIAGGMGMGTPVGMPMTGATQPLRGTRGPGLGWPFRMPPALPGRSMGGPGMQ
ncbi:hypothetical protein TA3x_003624 [Tundrisphaera sp. TA3]|uniref:hypothetical protein n=1 Tax=Tundrisphaera sp. TA3 TaxID=3435775 RepID=UPI003EBCE1CA